MLVAPHPRLAERKLKPNILCCTLYTHQKDRVDSNSTKKEVSLEAEKVEKS